MALGTITQLTNTSQGTAIAAVPGALKHTATTVVGDSSYPTGGSAITAAQLGFPNMVLFAFVTITATTGSNNGAIAGAYTSGGKLICFASAGVSPVTLVEVGNAVNLSGLTFTVHAYGY